MGPGMSRRDTEGVIVAASGVLGPIFLLFYFAAPLTAPALSGVLYAAMPSTGQIVMAGRDFHQLIALGTWIQATGSLLSVVFFLGLVRRAVATATLAGMLVAVGGATLIALVLAEGVFELTWISAATAGVQGTARVSFDLMSSFIHVFPIVPAPAVYLSLGALLVRVPILPRAFGPLALALGAAFAIVGLVGSILPAAAAAAGLSGLQAIWVLAAAIAFAVRCSRSEASAAQG